MPLGQHQRDVVHVRGIRMEEKKNSDCEMVWKENTLRRINKITLDESDTIEIKFVSMDIGQLQQKVFHFPLLWL